jgi:hypothetical protein
VAIVFMIFTHGRRGQLAKSDPNKMSGHNSKILSREWRWYMPPSEKSYWIELAEDYREAFKERFKDYKYAPRSQSGVTNTNQSSGEGGDRAPKQVVGEPQWQHMAAGVGNTVVP